MPSKHPYSALSQEPIRTPVGGMMVASSPRSMTYHTRDFYGVKERWRNGTTAFIEFCGTNAGILIIMSAQLFFAGMNLSVKLLNGLDRPVPTLELIIVRMVITLGFCLLYMVMANIPDPFLGPKGVRLLLVVRGVSGFFGLFGMYYSLIYLSLADATVLTFLGPISTAIAGYLILKESYSKKEFLAGVCSLLGVILIARPPFLFGNMASADPDSNDSASRATSAQRLLAVGAAFVGVAGGTGTSISIRAIGKRAHPLHFMTFFSVWCVIVASILMIVLEIPVVYPNRWEWVALLILVGIFGVVAQILLAMGLQRETATRCSMGGYIQVIFAGVFERVFFGTVPSFLSMIGAAIIMTCAVVIVLAKTTTSSAKADISLDSEDSTLEEGLLQGRASESEPLVLEEVFKHGRSLGNEDPMIADPPEHSTEAIVKNSSLSSSSSSEQ
ncbi:hypothetical protein BV22DRAFT_1093305 [Leucogyrophana mollusca]|uniref:Uncharacterized protein n=1 Tax=Leucogyrophana mollusca TaxID=85980 RepID=A0ACB8BBY5_9AGAM|nr:hypothetical protein BV22DRAFT_1093305 [Leucogyrophana mollusca]